MNCTTTGKTLVCKLVTHVLAAVVLAGLTTTVAVACDTPVYRYAMYNWNTTPYQVFFFHDGEEKTAASGVNRLLLELSTADEPVNMNLVEVDTSDGESVQRLPEQIGAAWKRCRDKNDSAKSGGLHVVFTPWGRELFAGQLDEGTLESMAESPARKQLCELLAQGKLVAVCLQGKQASDGRLVDEAIQTLSEKAADDGELSQVEVARLDVSTDDPKEKWFVKNLMLAEPDLMEYKGQTMVFMAYGRGRSMLPYIGKGITAENLARCVSFLTGACSCEVKADNPGVDLLIRCNWETVADAVAVDDESAPAREGELSYHEFDPSELSNGPQGESRKPGLETDMDQSKDESEPGDKSVETNKTGETVTGNSVLKDVAPVSGDSFASRQTWILGGSLAVILVVVFISGFFMMRRS